MSTEPRRPPPEDRHAADRTLLAWRRTALQVAIIGLLGTRLLARDWGEWVLVVGVLTVAAGLFVHQSAGYAYRISLTSGGKVSRRGRALALSAATRLGILGVAAVAVCLVALVWIVI